jgi:survival-of-motor-neuron-related-splicing factor 30
MKGKKKESIFKSPDGAGKVGVGTCGMAGKGMTEFQAREKWRNNTKG